MAAGHVYTNPAWLHGQRLREKLAVTRPSGARFSSVRFVTGKLDPLATRTELLDLAQRSPVPMLMVYGGSNTVPFTCRNGSIGIGSEHSHREVTARQALGARGIPRFSGRSNQAVSLGLELTRDLSCASRQKVVFAFGSGTDVLGTSTDVRFAPESGHWNSAAKCPLCPKLDITHRSCM